MLLLILTLLLTLLATRVLWRRWRYDLHRVPSPPGLPLLGHTLEFMCGQPTQQLCQWAGSRLKQLGYPKLMLIDLIGSPWLFVTDVDFIKDVMMSKTSPFPKNLANGFIMPMLGNDESVKALSMVSTTSSHVKAIRKIYATGFQSRNLKDAIPKLNGVVEKVIGFIEARRKHGPIDVQSLFVRMTLDAIGVVAFDTNMGGLDGSRDLYGLLLKTGYVCRIRFTSPFMKAYLRLFPKSKEAQRQSSIIDALTAEWEQLTKEILHKDNPANGEEPMWQALRSMKDPDTGEPLPFKALLCEVATAVVGGMDTTGHQLGWIFALLACHPRVVEKLLEELKEHDLYGQDAKELTFEDLGKLTYLAAVIKEGTRIAQILVVSFLRLVPEDMTILGYRIPKGTVIAMPGARAVASEEMWGDPNVFRPERWLTGEDMSQKYCFGFSVGPRDCVGQKLAMLEMRFAVVKLLARYQITLDGDLNDLFDNSKDGMVIEAKDGIWLQFEPRSSS